MKKKIPIALAIVGILVVVVVVLLAGRIVPPSGSRTYSSSELGFEFSYRAGRNGYVVQEKSPATEDKELVRTLVLIPTADVDKNPVGGEGAPTITISVFKNIKKQFPQNWADTHHMYSNINLKRGDVKTVVIGGANSIRYMADGLYVSDNVVVAHGENVYVLSGMFIDQDSELRRDYQPLLDSVAFIPTPNQK